MDGLVACLGRKSVEQTSSSRRFLKSRLKLLTNRLFGRWRKRDGWPENEGVLYLKKEKKKKESAISGVEGLKVILFCHGRINNNLMVKHWLPDAT